MVLPKPTCRLLTLLPAVLQTALESDAERGKVGWQGGGGWMSWWMDVCDVWSESVSPEPLWQLELAVSLQHHGKVEMKLHQVSIKKSRHRTFLLFLQVGGKWCSYLWLIQQAIQISTESNTTFESCTTAVLKYPLCVLFNSEFLKTPT